MMQDLPALGFDSELIRRYDRQGPRYTSYPTARQFESPFYAARYLGAIHKSNDEVIPRALSLYVHLPFCSNPCFYCGCTRLITRDPEQVSRYLQRLLREAAAQGALFDRDRPVRQMHLGGGTPTQLNDDQLQELWHGLRESFHFSSRTPVEASIEVDPRSVTPARVLDLAEMGFNRVSFGIQDLDPEVQQVVNRVQDPLRCLEVIAAAQASGFESVAVDLIYGLPRQTLVGFGATLEAMAVARPSRIAIYAYAHLPQQFKAQRQIEDADLPDASLRLQLLALAVETLTRAGYEYIGMDHFALPEDSLAVARREGNLQRNFQGYSTLSGLDLVGLGMSAIGHVGQVYAQNAKTLDSYYGALDEGRLPIVAGLAMNQDDQLRAEVINRLMCYDVLAFAEIERSHHIRFREYFAAELERLKLLAADGLVEVGVSHIRVLPRGRFLMRNIAMIFDAYLPQSPGKSMFSKLL